MVIGLAAAGLAVGGFETGRRSVDAASIAANSATIQNQPSSVLHPSPEPFPVRQNKIIIRDIATVPFSELYDVLKAAPREQLLAWARDLEQMPRGPGQRAAVGAYFKSLVQVDHRAALKALTESSNLPMRDLGEDALLKAAPESIWGEVAEALARMPYPGRGWGEEDVILNWSRVDPVAASKFIEKSPTTGEDSRLASLLTNWGEIDPNAAKNWLEADASRQTKDAFRAFVPSWGRADPAAAIAYAVANAHRLNFEAAVDELAYQFVRSAKEEATRLILLLPQDRAIAAVENVARITTSSNTNDFAADYQRPPAEVARWLVTLPVELWDRSIGAVADEWLDRDADSAMAWFDQLRPDLRDAVIVSSCQAAMSSYHSARQILDLGLTINDRALRDQTLGDFVRSFEKTMPGVPAIEQVNELEVSEEQKAYLRTFITESANGR